MFSGVAHGVKKYFDSNRDEIKFTILFASAITVNKYVLSELRFTVPTVFQGWQTFTCVLLLSVLVKFQNVSSELKMLDRRSFYLLLPGFSCFAFAIVAGSKGLSELPVPIFCAILSLHPAISVLMDKKTDFSDSSKRVCGSVAICGTVVVTLVMTLDRRTTQAYLWLLGHVLASVVYGAYMERIDLGLSSTSVIYYRNFFSVIVLLPVSIYLDVLNLPRDSNWQFYAGCILSGVLGTFLQVATARIESKANYLDCSGRAKLLCSLLARNLFLTDLEPVLWFLVLINLSISSTVLSPEADDSRAKSKLTFVVGPPHARSLNLEKAIVV